jgi:hypothetical protein
MNRVLINNVEHAHLRVAIRGGAAYGEAVNQLPIFPAEFEEAQREFPIVFRRREEGLQALVLLGLDKNENLFLDGEHWTSAYVPAIARRGPFSIGLQRDPEGGEQAPEAKIQIDLDDPRVGVDDGLPLFLEHGGNAPYLEHIAGVLGVLYDGYESAPAVYAALEQAGLLAPVTMQIRINDEQGYDLPDLFTIDQQALAALSGEPLERLHQAGLLRAATMAASSLGNVQRLIERKNRLLAAG